MSNRIIGFLSEKTILNVNRRGSISAILQPVLGIARWLVGFFIITQEDRLAAGIFLDGEGRAR